MLFMFGLNRLSRCSGALNSVKLLMNRLWKMEIGFVIPLKKEET